LKRPPSAAGTFGVLQPSCRYVFFVGILLLTLCASALSFPPLLLRAKFNAFPPGSHEAFMLSRLSIGIATVVTVGVSAVLLAQNTPRESLLILSKHDHTLAIVDPATLKVLTRIPIGDDPHEVIASFDGKTAWVSNYGGNGAGALHTLAVVDLIQQKPLASIDLGALRGPHGLDFAGGKLWFTAEAAKAFGSIDPASGRVDLILGTGQNRTHMIYVAQDLSRIFTTNVSSGTVSIFEKVTPKMPSGPPPGAPPVGAPAVGAVVFSPGRPPGPPAPEWIQTIVNVGNGDEGFDVTPDGKELWAANAQDGTISIIDISKKEVLQTLAANVRSANRLKFTPDGRQVVVSALSGPDVVVFDSATRKEIKRVPVGHGAAGIQMQPDGSRAFVACTPDNYVVAIDLKTLQVIAHIDAGAQPDGMAWAGQH
jgi:YVTN family beta-propeller protein